MIYLLFYTFVCVFSFRQSVAAELPDFTYSKNTAKNFSTYIDEQAQKSMSEGTHTADTVNDFRKEQERKYLKIKGKHLKAINLSYEFDTKVQGKSAVSILNFAKKLMIVGDLPPETVGEFIKKHENDFLISQERAAQKKKKNNVSVIIR